MLTRLFLCLCLTLPALSQSPAPQSVNAQSAALSALFKDVWQDELKSSPEFASALGDRRYNDQLTDNSPRAIHDALARRHEFLNRLLAIDTASLSEPERLSADLLQRQLIEGEEAAQRKEWEVPVNQSHGIHTDLPAMVQEAPFETVKDYDDYIARLHKIPTVLRQASENLLRGIDDHRVQPAWVLERVLAETEELAGRATEASPFALPLKRFPASIPAADRKRIAADVVEAIQADILPAYVRFAKFLKVVEIPAASTASAATEAGVDHPGNPGGLKVRQIKILELRSRAKGALGTKFDLQAFRGVVEAGSALPLEALEKSVNAWIAAAR